ncbi:MAG: gliding motility lipoprotein GldJ [Bacteroidetes bacterium MED-G17]|nr:MAG: gliding motility lipoprotein GldJ [Bacteroidetes bacterium MED-G17]CAI8256121.1 MAG: Hercynine oxygenase [Bacteroidetes bacterium MED-G17]|tara:strand:+ start:20248 stop:21675 length:1428 start_codon:yes stop_codon:yes gene_type:complete
MIKFSKILMITFTAASLFVACSSERSSTTGWVYNDPDWGGFETYEYAGQETGPGLILVHGGSFTMGSSEQDLTFEYNNVEKKVTVPSFYLDETEVSNKHYLEYLHWLRRVFVDYPEVYKMALPDTNCWRDRLAYNEPYVKYYLRHPSYQNYPVVGVSWLQATEYAAWRTDRVNEMILVREGILDTDPNQMNEENFNTDAYLNRQFDGKEGKRPLKDIMSKGATRKVKMEDGIFLPEYRLPTEAEWEYAAMANTGEAIGENINNKKIYPWVGHTVRNDGSKKGETNYRGVFMANVRRGNGDFAGIESKYNDHSFIPTDVRTYWPNDFGLYNMAGNVSEWVMDVYRPLSFEDVNEFNSFRGNVFNKPKLDEDGFVDYKDSLGRIQYVNVSREENEYRRNYKKSDNIGYLDEEVYGDGSQGYEYGVSTLIDNRARVYKGGNWHDPEYWMAPGTRRYLDEEQSNSRIGFRCAMHRLGHP